jgi:phosphate transport system protein
MPTREKFHDELEVLREKIAQLCNLAVVSLQNGMKAFETRDADLALKVIEMDNLADDLEEEINDFAILLIAKQQPVAIDLRRIIVAIKIANEIERVADFGVNIAKSTIRIGQKPYSKKIDHLIKMSEVSIVMLQKAVEAFRAEDINLAKKVAEMDDQVDKLYSQAIGEYLDISESERGQINEITQLLFIGRYLERSADHITNITEKIFYLVRGSHYDMNK